MNDTPQPNTTQPLLLNGARGRMGRAIIEAAAGAGFEVTGIDQGDTPGPLVRDTTVVVDFSHHTATLPLALLCARHGKPLVIGTTGHSEEERARIHEAVREIPVVWAGNYSVGVTLLNQLARIAAQTLDPSFQVELVEMHHRHKKDAPSGTAETLLQIIRHARALPPTALRHGRQGLTGGRPADEIGVHALRGGDVVGDHTVIFAGEGERLELAHKASSRAIFALGALRAARWLIPPPGAPARTPAIYNMAHVLGLE